MRLLNQVLLFSAVPRYVQACTGASTILRQLLPGQKPMVEVKINGVPRQLIVDTGSADTFIFTKDVQCIQANQSVALATCGIGDLYYDDFKPVDGVFFRQNYGGNAAPTLLSGVYGYATVEVAGLVLDRQRVAFVNRADTGQFWSAASGILGLAPRLDEAIYSVEAPPQNSTNNYNTSLDYPTVLDSLTSKRIISPVLSLTPEGAFKGGYLTLGGLPPIPHNQSFTRVPLSQPLAESYQYNINVSGISIGDKPLDNATFEAIVDSGTPANLLPPSLAVSISAGFSPPASADPKTGLYVTTCNATQPNVGINLGGTSFRFAQSLLVPLNIADLSQGCFSLLQPAPAGNIFILGSSFMENVVSVFDLAAQEMRFAQHEYDSLLSLLAK